MQTYSSMKRNIVLSLSILFMIGFASFGSLGGRVHAATLHPLKPLAIPNHPSSITTCDEMEYNCTVPQGDALQWPVSYKYFCGGPDNPCGQETWYAQNIPPHTTSTFTPPVTTGENPTIWTLQTAKDTPLGTYEVALAATSDKAGNLPPTIVYVDVSPPSLEIVDQHGVVVSNTTQTAMVGQKIHLQVVPTSDEKLSNIQWKLSGVVIKDYIHGKISEKDQAMPIDLSPADLQKADIQFYWIRGGVQTVTVSATAETASVQATATYNVSAPSMIDMRAQTGKVVAGETGFPERPGPWPNFGTNANPGIIWEFAAAPPIGDNGNGEIAGVQLINPLRTVTCRNGKMLTQSSGGAYVLDTEPKDPDPLYDRPVNIGGIEPWRSNDSPGIQLVSKDMSTVFARDNFEMYFMYKPAGEESIWVTIGLLYWDWTAETTYDTTTNKWKEPYNVGTPPKYLRGIDYNVLPGWSTNFTKVTLNPPSC